MKKFFFCCLFLALCSSSFAAKVVLKDGSTVEGKILERTANSVKLDMNGFTITYYNDEIDRVEGDSIAVAVPASEPTPAVAVPAVVAPAVSGMAKKDMILKFIDVFGTKETMQNNFDQMTKAMPADMAEKFQAAIKVEDIIKGIAPLYDRYFTEEELSAYIQFYSSPAGKKLVQTIPEIMKDSIAVSEKYFEEHLPEEFKQPPEPSQQ